MKIPGQSVPTYLIHRYFVGVVSRSNLRGPALKYQYL
jgi:hypothetical protein